LTVKSQTSENFGVVAIGEARTVEAFRKAKGSRGKGKEQKNTWRKIRGRRVRTGEGLIGERPEFQKKGEETIQRPVVTFIKFPGAIGRGGVRGGERSVSC